MDSNESAQKLLPSAVVKMIASLVTVTLVTAACVSVNIGPKGAERSQGVEFNAPGSPYESLKETPADGAWQNRANGNSISYFSTCNDPADPSLETVARELFAGLAEMKEVATHRGTFNGRESLEMEVEGRVEGVLTRIRSLMFKKNGCLYTLSHIGIPKSFEQDRSRFNEFMRSFQAP